MVTPLQLVHSQEVQHAPTVEQCRADQRLWLSKLEGPDGTNVTFRELRGWILEMFDCERVDPEFRVRYYNTRGPSTNKH
jgi:hypothetical protein